MENIVLKVEGMTCQGCVKSVTKVLQALPGVQHVDVSLEQGEAKIDCAPTVTRALLTQAIEDAGYDVPSN